MSSSAISLDGSGGRSCSAVRGFAPYSIATSWTSSASRFSPPLVVYLRGSNRAGEAYGRFRLTNRAQDHRLSRLLF
jgi:hypothetical protein